MDKELKELQSQFNQIPTSFTNKDKQAVRDKIENLQHKGRRKGFHIYPKLLTGIVLAVAVLIVAITIYQSPNLFMSSNDSNSDAKMAQEFSVQNEEAAYEMETSDSIKNDAAAVEESIPGEATNTYNETIELSDELLTVYEEYKNTLDDKSLRGLAPFDVFKLYHYADFQGDLEVVYALYFNKENHYVPDKETFIAEANQTNQQAKEFYNELLEIKTFDEIYLTESEALIRYTTDHDIGFRLFKDNELGVWKVSWLPIQ